MLANYQRGGLGRRLVAAGVTWLTAHDCHSMTLNVLEDNHPARRFYERLGGQYLTTVPFTLSGVTVGEMIYGWQDLSSLAYDE